MKEQKFHDESQRDQFDRRINLYLDHVIGMVDFS